MSIRDDLKKKLGMTGRDQEKRVAEAEDQDEKKAGRRLSDEPGSDYPREGDEGRGMSDSPSGTGINPSK
ncbi:hypothetical protein [Archangium lansingense]|uniref:CsbD family protein n=1 Tax=Archangium lansingense TaxID=2995310 RepID=A0ABT4AK30_9BACT|nr:hypothetical protein [Archangium lansinium]MCY1081651.1 hypothetical protein [Archangium lansinium]